MRLDAPIVIVGAGPGGISLALFLVSLRPELASKIVVLERAKLPRDKPCAGAVGMRALKRLAAIGVEPRVPSAPIRGIAVTTRLGTLMERSERLAGRVVYRRDFDADLVEHARIRGIAVQDDTRVVRLSHCKEGVLVYTAHGEVRRASVVVGADGAGSLVRRVMGLQRGSMLAQVAEVDTLRRVGDVPPDVVHFDLRDRSFSGYAWDFPAAPRAQLEPCVTGAFIGRGVYDLRLAAGRDGDDEMDVGERLLQRCSGVALRGRVRRYSERGADLVEPWSRPRVLLVGEAAGIDAALGEGIAQAILHAEVCAHYLVRALEAGDLTFSDYRAHLRTTRIGLDLAVRRAAVPWVYGFGRRSLERWVTRSSSLARVGLAYFAGERIPFAHLASALVPRIR